jgi:hypothetical protein
MRAGTSDAVTAIGFDSSDMRTSRDGEIRADVEVTGAARLYRAASGGMMGWASCGTELGQEVLKGTGDTGANFI